VCLSVVLHFFYGLTSETRLWSGEFFCAMASGAGANIFLRLFLSAYAIPGSLAPSLQSTFHCLTSDTSDPAHVPLQSMEVLFEMPASVGTMLMFRQPAFIPICV
jgi:hypothetical protein